MNRLFTSQNRFLKKVEWLLRIAVFCCFIGHGTFALKRNVAWEPYLETIGFNGELALNVMFYIGVLDIVVAILILIKPIRIVVLWACFWGLATALIRPISGESIWAFIERAPNWITPLVLYLLLYKKSLKLN